MKRSCTVIAGLVAAACALLPATCAIAADSCIVSYPEGDRDPHQSAVSGGSSVDARYLTVDVSEGWDLVTTIYIPGFMLIFK